jgi:hypothetical protein
MTRDSSTDSGATVLSLLGRTALLGTAERIEDPFIEAFRQMAYKELQPHHDAAIRRAEDNLALVSA